MYIYMYICIYIHTCIHVYTFIHVCDVSHVYPLSRVQYKQRARTYLIIDTYAYDKSNASKESVSATLCV